MSAAHLVELLERWRAGDRPTVIRLERVAANEPIQARAISTALFAAALRAHDVKLDRVAFLRLAELAFDVAESP